MLEASATAAARTIALERTPEDVLRSAVAVSQTVLDADLTFVGRPDERGMRISLSSGATDARFHRIQVTRGRGLGGQVLAGGTPMRVDDYGADSRITSDFVDVVCGGEGLHGIACVPIRGGDRETVGLLYAGRRGVGIADDTVAALGEIAGYAEIGLQVAAGRERRAQEDRDRIAAALHASVAQALFAIGVSAGRGARDPDAGRDSLLEAMAEIERDAIRARAELRETLLRLGERRPRASLDARLDQEVGAFSARSGCATRLLRRGESPAPGAAAEDLVLDFVLEGLANAVKHQEARLALVTLDRRSPDLRVTVQSEGGGEPADASAATTGCGLELLRRRAAEIGGVLELEASAGAATLRLRLPTAR